MANEDIRIKLVVETDQATKNVQSIKSEIDGIGVSVSKADQKVDFPSLRYALYDVANAAGNISSSINSVLGSVVNLSSSYESAFTDIQRTTFASSQQLSTLNEQFKNLATQIPLTFQDLTSIGAMGAQLGIASSDLTGFTDTVAKFAASTNVSTEKAAQSFGALGQLLNVSANEYGNLGSAIAYVGVKSVATESQILSVSEAIGGVAGNAGLTADYTIGLAGALASLKIPAEQSRGAITRMFQEIQRSAAGTGVDMSLFANIMGTTASEATALAQTDMQSFFSKFVTGLSSIDPSKLVGTLDALNLSDIRVYNVAARLARNTDLLNKTMADSSSAYKDATFLNQAYAYRVEDLASKIQILQNNISNLGATVGDALSEPTKKIVDTLSNVVKWLDSVAKTDAGKALIVTNAGFAGLVSVVLSAVAATATFTASLFAVRFAIERLGWSQAEVGGRRLIATMFGASAAATEASVGIRIFGTALKAIPVLLAIATVSELVMGINAAGQAAESSSAKFNSFFGSTSGLSDALAKDTMAYNQAVSDGNSKLAASFAPVQYAGENLNKNYGEMSARVNNAATALGVNMPGALGTANAAIDQNTRYIGDNTKAWMVNQLMLSDTFQTLASNPGVADFFKNIGFDFGKALELSASGGEQAVRDYFMRQTRAALESGKITLRQIQSVDSALYDQLVIDNGSVALAPSDGLLAWSKRLIWAAWTWMKAVTKNNPFAQAIFNLVEGALGIFGINMDSLAGKTSSAISSVVDQSSLMDLALQAAGENGTNSLEQLGGSAGGAAEKIRTLTDYANDLASVWERARDLRFSGTETLDKVTSAFQKIAQATSDARDEINGLQADTQKLQADQALQQYFLSVAEAYGDTLKAQEIRANLSKIDGDLTKKTKDLQKAQDKTNKTLVGNSEAAISNRAEVLDLVTAYQDHIKALASSGMSQSQLAITTAQLKQDFIAQATQLGYNVTELGNYALAFDDVGAAIDAIPRDITVDFNGDPALTAIQEFAAKSRSAISGAGGNVAVGADTSHAVRAMELLQQYMSLNARWSMLPNSEREGKNALMNQMANIKNILASEQYATGGYISGPGTGTSDSIMARVSNGEYVVRASAVQKYGVGFFDRLNQMQSPRFASGGYVAAPSSSGIVSLSPEDRALLRGIGGSGEVVLYADSRELARSVNEGNKMIVAAGGRP